MGDLAGYVDNDLSEKAEGKTAMTLTKEQQEKLLKEYDNIPQGPNGGKWRGVVSDLARRWGVKASTIAYLREKRRKRKT